MTYVDRGLYSRRLPGKRDAILSPAGRLPMAIALIGMLVLAACVSIMGLALLKILPSPLPETSLRRPPSAPHPESDPHAEMLAREREMAVLDTELHNARQRMQDLEREQLPARDRSLALNRQKDQLIHLIEQRRTSLHEYEDAHRREVAQQDAIRQRVERLRAEAAELERRIAALKANVGEARSARATLEKQKPQNVECVLGAVILQPQHLRIPLAELTSGAFVAAVAGRGVSFLVRPDGIDSFVAARAIARAAGVTVGYEPVLAGRNP